MQTIVSIGKPYLFLLRMLHYHYQDEALSNGKMLMKHLVLSFIVTTIPCIDLEFTSLNMIMEIQLFIPISLYRYINIEKLFVNEIIL